MDIAFKISDKRISTIVPMIAATLTPAVVYHAWQLASVGGREPTALEFQEAQETVADRFAFMLTCLAGRFSQRPVSPPEPGGAA